jgi:hypothetical protein
VAGVVELVTGTATPNKSPIAVAAVLEGVTVSFNVSAVDPSALSTVAVQGIATFGCAGAFGVETTRLIIVGVPAGTAGVASAARTAIGEGSGVSMTLAGSADTRLMV